MVRAPAVTLIAAVLLFLSAAAVFLPRYPLVADNFQYLMWIHVAIIALLFWGEWRRRKIAKALPGGLGVFLKGLPVWLVVLALPVGFVVAPLWSFTKDASMRFQDSRPHTRMSWHQDGSRYFVVFDKEPPTEISLAEFQNLQRTNFEVFARAWVLFSYGNLVLWQYIVRRERTVHQNAG